MVDRMECPVCHGTQVQVYGSTLVRCRVRDCEGHSWHTLDAWNMRVGQPTFHSLVPNSELERLRAKAALADDLYRIWRGHEHACRSTMYLEHWMGRYEAIK